MISRLVVLVALAGTAGAEPLSVIPARYQAVGWFATADAPLFAFIRSMPGGVPPCVDTILATTDGYLQAQLPKVKTSIMVFAGKVDRAAAESCLQVVLDKIGATKPRVTPMGAITEVATEKSAFYLGWAGDGTVVEARDKADVEEVLAKKTHPNADVMALIGRVDRKKAMWFAGALDYGTPLLGVASMGYFASMDTAALKAAAKANGPESIHVYITLVFPTPGDAKRASAAIAKAATNKRFSPALQEQLGKLGVIVKGADVAIDVAPLFWKMELMTEMTQAITELATH
jgi:hypothetical protein